MQTWAPHIIRLLEEPEIGVLLGATALLLGVVSRSYHGAPAEQSLYSTTWMRFLEVALRCGCLGWSSCTWTGLSTAMGMLCCRV